MAEENSANVPAHGRKAASKEGRVGEKPATSWVIPVITAVVLASAFCIYYFVYVAAQREYLANRNFRSLAVLGDQIQTIVSVHGSILEFSADLAEPTRNPSHRDQQKLSQFLVVHSEDVKLKPDELEKETQKDYLKYLAPDFDLTEAKLDASEKQSKPESRLQVRRRNGRWELLLSAQRHAHAKKDYTGSLELENVLRPLVASLPFDDILLVSEKGVICYQSNRAGPQFTTLTSLLQAQPEGTEKPSGGSGEAHGESRSGNEDRATSTSSVNQNQDQTWHNKSKHLTDVTLAGTRYKLFLQPVLVDVFSDDPDSNEPAREWVLCGLRSAKALQWEALSVSSTAIIAFTAVFLAVCMSGPLLKILFMNQRERLRLRELGALAVFLVLLTSVFTLSGLEAVGFPLNDDTEERLRRLGEKMSGNIYTELRDMRNQLQEWCNSPQLRHDLALAKDREIIRNKPDPEEDEPAEKPKETVAKTPALPRPEVIPEATKYPYLNNAFWTDDDGHQVVKWSTSGYLTPMIDVSPLRIYSHPKSTYLDGRTPPFHFDSLVPPNKFEYLAVLGISTKECASADLRPDVRGDIAEGSAVLTAQPFSLIDPILPLGYGFALLDDTGSVLFHSDKTRNLHENFLQESDWSRQLYAASFGHSTERSLPVKYLGKDYRARVIPVRGVSQAPWSLIVYRDLTSVRTLNLQAMTMTTTLLLVILALPVAVVAIWCAIRRPRFAPEWVWPNAARRGAYMRQSAVYALLIVLFLFLGFAGSSEQNVVACFVVPYAALLLTVWCFRAHRPTAERSGRSGRWLYSSAGMLSLLGSIALLAAATSLGVHSQLFKYLFGMGIIAALPLLAQPRQFLATTWNRSFHAGESPAHSATPAQPDSYAWRKSYVLSLVLLLFLLGVLTPMALFRVSLNVERRLAVKQAQLHLASALGQRLISTRRRCVKGELGEPTCAEFENKESKIWSRIVLDPMFPSDGKLPVRTHSAPVGGELYTGWLQKLVYALHHDYNKDAAEMLGIIPDRFNPKPGSDFPDWAWENNDSGMTLRWHGIHLLKPGRSEVENDLLIESTTPVSSSTHAFAGAGVGIGVILAIGAILWALVRKIFLFNVVPLKMTGARQAVEAIRQGRNVAVLVPPVSDWHLEGPKWTLDVKELATGPKWAEALDLESVPLHTVIEVVNFEYSTNDGETDNQKLLLLLRLLARENTQVCVVLTVPVSSVDYRRMFPAFEVVDLREEPFFWLKQYEGPGRDLIWKECGPMPALWPIGVQLAKDIKNDDSHSEETIASEMLERADPYYRLIWKECTNDQKFVLAQLAEDGLLNPTNSRAIRQMVRRGFITADPQFRIVNESFRRFLRSHTSAELKKQWLSDSKRSGWGKAHGAFFTTMLLLGVFLLTTQNELWESSAAYVTTALGALGTLSKLWNTYRGGVFGGSSEKAD